MFLYMRLSKKEIQVILRVAKEIYGETEQIMNKLLHIQNCTLKKHV